MPGLTLEAEVATSNEDGGKGINQVPERREKMSPETSQKLGFEGSIRAFYVRTTRQGISRKWNSI